MPQYYCHRCQRSFDHDLPTPLVACSRCQDGFVEIVTAPQPGSIQMSLNQLTNVFGPFLANPGANAQNDARQQQQHQIFRTQMENLNEFVQAQARAQAQGASNAPGGAPAGQPTAPPQQNQPNQQANNPLRLFLGTDAPADIQELFTQGLPRYLAGLPFTDPSQREQAGRDGGRGARGDAAPGRQRANPPGAPNPHSSLEDFITALFDGSGQATPPENPPTMEVTVEWRGAGGAGPEVESTMNNFFMSLQDEHAIRGFAEPDVKKYLPMKKVTQKQIDNGAQCTTCFDMFKLNDDVGALDCNHIFHRPCIEPWLTTKNSCPVCRQKVSMQTWKVNHAKKAQEAVLEDLD